MDYFYDGQIRRYVTQFMRVFIGFKWKAGDGTYRHVPVSYGDMTRQVAGIIKDNSENKLSTVPRIACYITNIEMDMSRISDATFVSKLNIRERKWEDVDGNIEYQNIQGAGYTVERLMPTPFKLSMKADIWTSNTDQKLQLFEQIMMLFNPSLELQTTDNYVDWTSLSVLDVKSINFSSRTIPQGAESEIDICSIEFEMPIYISPPAKVKKLGVIRNIVMNVFSEQGDILGLEDLIYNGANGNAEERITEGNYGILLIKSSTGDPTDGFYDVSVLNPNEAVVSLGLEAPTRTNDPLSWTTILDVYGGYISGVSKIWFLQANGTEIGGTVVVNELDPTKLLVSIEEIPSNSIIDGATYVDAIIDPYKFNPLETFGTHGNIPSVRYLMLDDVNNSKNVGSSTSGPPPGTQYDGPDAWKNSDLSDPVIKANSIIKWNGSSWETIFDPDAAESNVYIRNLRTGIQYRWDGEQWLRSFEGEYAAGYWRFDLDPQ
jgi:hypothetical protein